MRQKVIWLAVLAFAAAFLTAVLLFDWDSINSYSAYNTSTLHYVRARVVSMESETLEKSEYDENLILGEQQFTAQFLEGEQKGETVTVSNYLTQMHSIVAREGQTLIICADTPENVQPYYTVFSYDRTLPVGALVASFALAVVLIGRGKGVRALLGVAFTLLTVVLFLVQGIYHGFSPVAITAVTVLLTAGVTLLLLNGFQRKTAAALLSTLAGVLVTGVLFAAFSALLHLTGYCDDSAETLLMVSQTTGLSIRHLLLAGVLISSLGAVMDIAVSLSSALDELKQVDPTLTRGNLLRSGMNIGRDMIGTMSNTLILAFAGTALNTMLCLMAYGYQFSQLLSSNYLAIELAQGLCATLGVVLTVPVATQISALFYCGKNRQSLLSAKTGGEACR